MKAIVIVLILSWVEASPESELDKLQKEFFDWLMKENPEYSTSVDIHTYDDQLDDMSVEMFDRWKTNVDGFLATLATIPRDNLNKKYRIDYDIFENYLKTYQDGYKWKDYNALNSINFLEGPHIDPDILVSITPKSTKGDFENFIARIEGYQTQISQIKARFQRAVTVDKTYHNVSVWKVFDEIDKTITADPEDFSFYTPFKDTLGNISTIPNVVKTDLRNRAKAAIQQYFAALRNISDYMKNDYSSHLRQGYGVCNWHQGSEFYEAVLQWHTSLPLTPDEVHQKGLEEVERISKEMQKIIDRLGLKGTIKEVFDAIKNDSRFHLNTGQDIIDKYNYIIHQEIEPKLPLMFKNLPGLPVEVQPNPVDGVGGQYITGAADGSRPGVFQVNVFHPHEALTIGFMALAMHETSPGHHLQLSTQLLAKIPEFRRQSMDNNYFQPPTLFPFYTAYLEGWALYAESLGEELGLYKTDYDLLGRYSSEIFRACRLVVDTGLHYKNWTRQEAMNYMSTYTSRGASSIETEIDRYLTWPGQACAYKIGEQKFKELRNKAKTVLGELFDIKDFHAVVLENGAVPMSMLETIVDDWIEETRMANSRTSEYPSDDLKKLENEFSDWVIKMNPEASLYMNIKGYETEVTDYSLKAFDDLKNGVDDFLWKLGNIHRDQLDAKRKVDYDIFKETLLTYHDGYQWRFYTAINPIHFLTGPQAYDPADELDLLPKNMTVVDLENFISRINKYPIQVHQWIARMDKAISVGRTYHNVSMFRVPKQLEGVITDTPEQFAYYRPFNDTLDNITGITDDKKRELRQRAKTVIGNYLNSLRELKDYIVNTYMQHLRPHYGVSSWEHGDEFYQACLKWHLSLPLTPEEVHQKGLSEVQRISTEIQKIFKKLNLTGSTKAVFDQLKHDPKFLYNDSSKILEKYNEIIFERIKPKLPKLFKNIPDLPLEVRPMATDGPGGMYMTGSPDGSRPGIFLANLFHPDESPTFNFADLALHEALPGHHLQLSYQSTATIPQFRTSSVGYTYMVPAVFPGFTSYIEGWALYAESLGEEMGVFVDDYELLGRYSAEIFRACRLVVDTGIHHYNWTQERAIEYMLNYTAYGKSDLTNEVNRYITWPGQACAYKIGELKIRELRTKAEKELGDKFDIADFHLTILQNGAMPLNTLETIVYHWIADKKESDQNTVNPAKDLKKLQDEFSEWLIYENPEFATSINDPRYNDRLDDYSIEEFDRLKDVVDRYLKDLDNIAKDKLTEKEKVDYDIFKDFLVTYHDGYKWRMYNALNPLNFLEGFDPSTFAGLIPKHTKGDFDNFITRIDNMPKQVKQMQARFERAIEVNHTYHRVSISSVPEDIATSIRKGVEEFPLYKPFTEDLDKVSTIPYSEKEEIRMKAKSSITRYMDALQSMMDYINGTYLDNTRKGYGVSNWTNGDEYYKACLKWHTSLSITPEEVHRKGLEEVARISGQMQKIFSKLGIPGSVKKGFDALKNDSSFFLATGNEVVEKFKSIIFKQIQPHLSKLFKDTAIPPLAVKESPTNGPGGFYHNGSPDGSKPGTFYVNTFHPEEMPTFGFMSLALHEAIPGHHLQISKQMTQADLAGFRRYGLDSKYFQPPTLFPFYTAYVEGWALYSEYLGEEMGLYDTDYKILGRYSDEMLRACRLVVDTGLHYFGWSRQRAIDYMSSYLASGQNDITIEVDRYITWPGQACAYKMGELKIKELRSKASTALGSHFDVKEFHSTVLKNGPVPLSILETVIDQWIADVKANIPSVNNKGPNDNTNTAVSLFSFSHIYISILIMVFYNSHSIL